MKVLLIEVNPYVPVSLPISLGYLAAVLRAQGHEAMILNIGEGTLLSPASFRGLLLEVRPGLVGFAAYQRNMLVIRGMAQAIKEADSAIRIILGGPQATFMPSEALVALPEVDFICRGEGEGVISEVVRALESGASDRPAPGTTTRLADGHWEDGPPVNPPEDLDQYPSPFLQGTLDLQGLEEATMLTSRGCPYHCLFCYTPRAFGNRIRYNSVERVLEEMTWLNRRGIQRFWLADPSFSFRRDRAEELLQGVLARKIRASMWLETRADLVDSDLLELMAAAGVRTLALGLESASERVLDGLGKRLSLSHMQEAVALAQGQGIEVELFSLYALPQERYEDALETLNFVQGCVPIRGNTNAQQMRLYFGTPFHDRQEEYGIRPQDGERPAYISIGSRYETQWMSAREIHRIRDLWKAASLDGGKRLVS